jgi:hypothetical protein
MRSVTEFFSFKLVKGISAKTALAAEGKSPEEIEASLAETFKFEGDKLKQFLNCMEVASTNMENLTSVQVISINEGESAPEKAIKIEELYYVPEFKSTTPPPAMGIKKKPGSGPGGGKGKSDRPKTSPWGLTPEEIAAKKGKGKAAAATAPKKA